ncbi:MAG: hypothetical protein QXT64_01400 [Desulfurococcaceae archaeon]
MVPVARVVLRGKLSGESYEAVAVALDSHQEAVAEIVEKLFVDHGLLKSVALVHDKFKPATMRLEARGGEQRVGFRGHPYMLSFTDFENKGDEHSVEDVAVATAIGRLHHFINVRDVDSFVHTMALAKSYLDSKGAHVKLSELKKRVLHGLLVLHVADMVAGFTEQALLENTVEAELYDTESLEAVEPHLPLSMTIGFTGNRVELQVVLHGLSDVLRGEVLENGVLLDLSYRVCRGTLRVLGGTGRAVFEPDSCTTRIVHASVVHKRRLIRERLIRGEAGARVK